MKKVQISASVRPSVQEGVKEEAVKDERHFSEMVDILLGEALKARRQVVGHLKYPLTPDEATPIGLSNLGVCPAPNIEMK